MAPDEVLAWIKVPLPVRAATPDTGKAISAGLQDLQTL
jgi:hypothetical protein